MLQAPHHYAKTGTFVILDTRHTRHTKKVRSRGQFFKKYECVSFANIIGASTLLVYVYVRPPSRAHRRRACVPAARAQLNTHRMYMLSTLPAGAVRVRELCHAGHCAMAATASSWLGFV